MNENISLNSIKKMNEILLKSKRQTNEQINMNQKDEYRRKEMEWYGNDVMSLHYWCAFPATNFQDSWRREYAKLNSSLSSARTLTSV